MKKYLQDGKKEVEARKQDITRHAGGKPRVVTDEMKKGMLTVIANGLTPAEACAAMGVSMFWIEKEMQRYPEFEIEVQKSIQQFKLYHLNNIHKHSKVNWAASAWLLERTFPERFNARVAQEIAAGEKEKKAPTWFGKAIEGATVEDVEYTEESREAEKPETKTEEEVKQDDKLPDDYKTNPEQFLTDREIRKIRKEYKNTKVPYSILAKDYGVSKVTISKIINRQSYKDVK